MRAKFRCLSVTHRLTSGGKSTDTSVELKPVIAKSSSWPGGSEENVRFWSATPTGEANWVYRDVPANVPFVVGSYYYIDLEEIEGEPCDRSWKLWKVEHTESTLTVQLGLGWEQDSRLASASLSMGIENRGAWPVFENKAGSRWAVMVSDADAPPADASTYP